MFSRLASEIRFRLRALVRRDDVQRELDDELGFHLEREVERQMGAGLPRAEAERRARVAFGGVRRITEDTRDAHGVAAIEALVQDLRYAVRGLRSRPAFTAGILLTLGLGIGVNAAMFGIVDRLLLRAPASLAEPDRVHRVYLRWKDGRDERLDRSTQFPRYLDFVRLARTTSAIAAFQVRTLPVGIGDDMRELPVAVVSATYFDFFDARPVLGRFFSQDEDRVPAGAPVAVLSHGFWQSRLGGRPDVLGQRLMLDRTDYTVVGVAPAGYAGVSDGLAPAAFLPITSYAFGFRGARYADNYNWGWLELLVRRAPGVSVRAAEADLTGAFRRSWELERGEASRGPDADAAQPRVELGPVQLGRGPEAGLDASVATWVSGMALVVLLIACANVAGLLLSRAMSRRREVAMRRALGVRWGRLVRQMLTESLVLAATGGAVGLLLAQWGGGALRAMLLPDGAVAVASDARTLVFVTLASVVTGALMALAPVWYTSREDVAATLRDGGRGAAPRRSAMRAGLLVLQAGLSVVLLVGAGLFVRSLQNARGHRMGYDADRVLYAVANPRGTRLTPADSRALAGRMLEAARSVPGVEHVSLAVSIPFWSEEGRGLFVDGVDSLQARGRFVMQAGTPAYFATMGTRILRGRAFDDGDRAAGPPVVVVSEGMARAIWPGQESLGRCLRVDDPAAPCRTVVGIAEEAHISSLADPREFAYYLPVAQFEEGAEPQLLARVAGDPTASVEALRRRLQRELPGVAYVNVVPLRDLVDPAFRAWEFGATMFVAFGGLALLLASVGLYSLMSHDVAQRRQELGVRMALGASPGSLVRGVVFAGLRLVAIGLAAGAAIALVAGRWVEGLLFQLSARDPVVFAVAVGVLLVVAAVAGLAPALAAAHVDPNVVLRED